MATGSSNELLSDWFTGKVSLHERVRVFVLEATRGGLRSANQDAGDVCIDDLQMTEGACESKQMFFSFGPTKLWSLNQICLQLLWKR